MTPTEALEMLLIEEPLTDLQILEVTGWPAHKFEAAIADASREKRIERCHHFPYQRGTFTAWTTTQKARVSRAPLSAAMKGK